MNYESLRSLIREALLLELRNVGGEGPPSSSKYFARPIDDGFVLYYDVGSGGRPQAVPGTIGQYYDVVYALGAKSVSGKDYNLSPDQLAKAKELVDLGVYKTTEEPNKYPDIEFSSSRKGSPGSAGLLWKSEKDVPPTSNSYYPKSPQFDFLLVDTDQKMVSLDASWTGNQSRRGGSTPTNDSSKSYVIPSGDVAFESDTLTLQKLFKHLIAVDSRVTADYKIVSPDDKFAGKTIGGFGGTGTEYEDTRQKVLKKVKRFGESRLRDLVRGYLAEETLGIHGALMDDAALMKSLGHGGIKINPDGPVTDEEADAIAKKLKSVERVYAYSRGAAALSKATQDDDFEGLPPVTYVAPAALRKWTDAPVPRAPGGSVTIIGDKDSAVPVKQACQVAKNAGTPLYVYPGKSHKSILYTKGEVGGDAYEVNVDSCVSDPEMPDWGREATGTEEEVAKQIEKIKTHSKNESLIRSLVRAGMKR